jgi:hypothetical protein
MGPEGKSPEDTRLDALKAHRAALAASPSPVGESSLFKALLPLIVAQGLDLLSTEKPLGFLRVEGMAEGSPLPGTHARGMAGTSARLGWGGLETALIAAIAKADPKVGNALVKLLASSHMEYAKKNMEQAEMNDRLTREGIPWHMEPHW